MLEERVVQTKGQLELLEQAWDMTLTETHVHGCHQSDHPGDPDPHIHGGRLGSSATFWKQAHC